MTLYKGIRFYSALLIILQTFLCLTSNAENVISELEDELFVKHDNHNDRVTIYTDANFWGIPWSFTVTNCTDVPRLLYRKASSIDTHDNCMILYSRQECQGRHVRIAPGTDGHSHLSDVGFDNTLASLKPCDASQQVENSTSSTKMSKKDSDLEHNRIRRSPSILDQLMGTESGEGSGFSSPAEVSETMNENNNNNVNNSESEEPDDDGAVEMPAFLQNFNLKSLINKLLNNDNSNEGNGWLSGRFKRAAKGSEVPVQNSDNSQNDTQQTTSTPHPPLQNVIY